MVPAFRTLVEAIVDGFLAFLGSFGHFWTILGDFGPGSLPSNYLLSIFLGWVGKIITPSLRYDYPLNPPNSASRPIMDREKMIVFQMTNQGP